MISEGGDGVSTPDPRRDGGNNNDEMLMNVQSQGGMERTNPDGGNAGNIEITAKNGKVTADKIETIGGDAAGESSGESKPVDYGRRVILGEFDDKGEGDDERDYSYAVNGGKGGNGGNVTVTATDVELGTVETSGGNGGMATSMSGLAQADSPNKAIGGNGGNIDITAENDATVFGALSVGGNGGIAMSEPMSRLAQTNSPNKVIGGNGGNGGNVNIKADNNVELGDIGKDAMSTYDGGAGSVGGAGGTNSSGGNAGNVNVEAGGEGEGEGKVLSIANLVSQGGQGDYSGNDSKGAESGDVTVKSTGAGDIEIGAI